MRSLPPAPRYLAITLSRLDDFTNSVAAYEKAIDIEYRDSLHHLNFAITLFNHGDLQEAKRQFELFEECFAADQLCHRGSYSLGDVETRGQVVGGARRGALCGL